MLEVIVSISLISGVFPVAHEVYGHGNATLNDSMNVRYVGHLDTPGDAYGVAVQGPYAYIADGFSLRIADITDPSNPTEVGFLSIQEGDGLDVWVCGDYAYVAAGGLKVVDVSDPSAPQLVGQLDIPGTANRLMVVENLAYIASDSGVSIVDISNPSSPTLMGSYRTQQAVRDVYVTGNYAYLAGVDSFFVIDICDPASPQFVAGVGTQGQGHGIFVSEHYLFLANYSDMRIYDVDDPSNPQLVTIYDQPYARFKSVFVQNEIAYVITARHGIFLLNVSDPSNPQDTGFYYNVYGTMTDVNVVGDYIYVAAYQDGLQIYEFDVGGGTPGGDSLHISYIGHLNLSGDAYGIHVQDNYAYVANGFHGLEVVDVSDPFNPFEAAHMPVNAWDAVDVFVSGNYAYVLTNGDRGLHIVDISNPLSPNEVGYISVSGNSGYGNRLFVSGNYAYIATGDGLRIVDVSAPSSPIEVGQFDTRFADVDVYVDGNYAYLAALEDFYVLDVSNPSSPESLTCLTIHGQVHRVFVHDGYAYVVRYGDIYIYDVSDPSNPILAGVFDPSGITNGILLQSDLAYVITSRQGWWLLDASNPSDLRPIDYYYNIYGTFEDIFVQGEYAYIAAYADGLQIYWISPTGISENAGHISNSDIEFKTSISRGTLRLKFSLPVGMEIALSLYDISGRLLWRKAGQFSAGNHQFTVSHNFRSGIYILKLQSTTQSKTFRVIVLQ